MLWYGACNYVIINYVCSVFSHWLCFHHSSDFSMQEDSSIQLNTHQSTVHRKVYVCCCGGRMHCLAARAIKPIPLAYCHEHMWCWSSSLGDFSSSMCGHFWHHGVSLLAPLHLCSPLGVGFPPLLTFFSCCYHWFPMYDDSTKRNSHAILMASTSLECFHFFWNIAFTLGLLRYSRLSTVLWNKSNKENIVGPWNKERIKVKSIIATRYLVQDRFCWAVCWYQCTGTDDHLEMNWIWLLDTRRCSTMVMDLTIIVMVSKKEMRITIQTI